VPIIYAQYLYWYWYLKVMYWYWYWYLKVRYWYWYWYLLVEYLIQDWFLAFRYVALALGVVALALGVVALLTSLQMTWFRASMCYISTPFSEKKRKFFANFRWDFENFASKGLNNGDAHL